MKDRRKIVPAMHGDAGVTPDVTTRHRASAAMLRKSANETALIF
ncbi:hypothetical protein [Undibacterium sp. 14-3-2]|nr:hypothetical protein [Undibacterium sp. 14-3-2]